MLALSKAMDQVAEGHYDVEVPRVRGGGEIGHLTERFREMTARLAEAEELERNFLMSVSHELRTPLTAIRGHVAALREGVVTDPEAADESLEIVAEEAERLGRLVGDVLDLAKLDAHRFTVLTEEVDMGRLLERAYSTFAEEARQRGIEYTQELDGGAGDRLGRRPRAADHLEPALERLPLDAGRRADRPRAAERERHGHGRRRRHRARGSQPTSASGSSGRSGRPTGAAPGSGCRSRASSRWRSAAGSSWRARWGRGAASGSSCRSGGCASRRLGARRTRVLGCGALVDGVLDALEPVADALPAGRDEVDEQGEVVDARMPLGEDVALEPLEPADRLVQQAADLGEVARDREHLGAQAVVDGGADLLRQRSLELRRRLGERLDLGPRALQRRLELGRCDPARGRFRDPGLGPLECLFVHGREDTLAAGWRRPSSRLRPARRS